MKRMMLEVREIAGGYRLSTEDDDEDEDDVLLSVL